MKQWFPWYVLIVVFLPPAAFAQGDPEEPTVLTIRPASEPTPALKYRLLPDRRELVPGNAAIFYHRAFNIYLESRSLFVQRGGEPRESAPWDENRVFEWINGPIDQVPLAEARAHLDYYRNALHELELGAIRQDCDWEYDSRSETIDLPLPEMNYARSFARLIMLRVRVAILEGDLDGAIHWLRVGYALARHVSEGPTIIQWLVGVAIAGMMNTNLMELIQSEGTPSLYWAIAELPAPLIDIKPSLDGERSMLVRMFPDIQDLEGPVWSVEQGRLLLDRMAEQLKGFTDSAPSDSEGMRLLLVGMIAKTYPEAKRSLIDLGMTEEMVEAMPAIQVVGITGYRRWQELSDDSYKWMSLPYWQSYQRFEEPVRSLTVDEKLSNPGNALFALLHPALSAVRMAEVRTDRQFAALRCIEAIRLHAEAHDGRLPTTLEELTEAPSPIDPATGKPFGYEVEGDAATLSAPLIPGGPDHPAYRINYRLRLAE